MVPAVAGCGLPYVIGPVGGFEPHIAEFDRFLSPVQRLLERLRAIAIRRAMNSTALAQAVAGAELVLASTPESHRALLELGASRVEIVAQAGLYAEHFELLGDRQRRSDRGNGDVEIVFSGRLVGWKGEAIALYALAEIRDLAWRFTVVGDGANRANLEALARRLGIADRLQTTGMVSQEQSFDYLRGGDLFLYPSLRDSGGMAVLEAMAARLPVVCLAAGGPGFYVTSETGRPVQPASGDESLEGLVAALRELIGDRDLRARLGAAARERCERYFTWEARERKFLDLVRPVWEQASGIGL